MRKDLNIVFKISERCNLKCDYCYFFFGGDETWKKHPPLVSREVVQDLGAFVARAARDEQLELIHLIFHGGEPLLMSKPRFTEMCETLRGYENGFQFSFALQTNGVLVDEGWIDIFERYRVTAGVSLDGPPVVNDLHRLDFKGRSSYDATVAGLRLLQQAATQGRVSAPGLLCVINPFADGAKVYRHFVDDLGVKHMSFLTPDYTWDSIVGEPVIRGVERFLLAALRAWLADKNPKIQVRVFSELLAAMVDQRAMELVQTYRDDYRNIISVSSNGDLGPEDTLRTLDPRFASMGLNVESNDLRDLFESGAWREQADAVTIRPEKCKTCDWWKLCKAGRPVNRYSRAAGFSNHSLYCSGLKDLYAEIGAFLVRNGTPLAELALRLAS
ncbi:MAG: radical SAM protein [Acidobacteriaceae bacterium]|nr:radical SAM protein [Acidobacteriaceae bacterium]MBV9501648.1 radical SAM protein [Acidobacteriaceae bacterium]